MTTIELLLLYLIPWTINMVAVKIITKTGKTPENIEFATQIVIYAFIPALNLISAGLMIFTGCVLAVMKIADYVTKNM